MQGYVPVEIPTKRYIKSFIQFKLGEKPVMDMSSPIGSKLYDVLQHSTNERMNEFSVRYYNTQLRIYIPRHSYIQRGAFLNETNIKNFNLFVEGLIKERYRSLMDDLIEVLPSFEANLPEVRKKIGVDVEAWSDDSIRKDYYRYRKNKGLPPLYNKMFTRSVPSERLI